ncbi:recombinase family protein [Paenibacillus enshidis]|uniref:Recombinase family protein n=1 Tax=Paenibacillus enshidis TaxID=1458439 RepID=A0ABV5B0W0_9BACL
MSSIEVGCFGATYLRISRDKGENEDTLQNHREIMTEFCRQNGYTYEMYEEIVSGGKYELEERPQLQQLLQNIEKYKAIFTVSLDRLARNGVISQQIKQVCIDHEIKIITPSQTFDLCNSLEDRVLYDVSSMFAVMEYEMIGRRNKYNRMQRARRGEYVSGKPAFGYRRNGTTSKLEIYEPEAEVVRYIFKLHSEGLGKQKIADILNSEGYKTQRQRSFQPSTVKAIINNPVYKGCLVLHDRKYTKENGEHTFKVVDTIITDDAHPAIIAPDEWEQAKRERAERGAKAAAQREKATVKTGTTMLKDLLYCGICGGKLFVTKYLIKPCEYLLPDSGEKCGNHGMRLILLEEEVLCKLQAHRERLWQGLLHIQQQDALHLLPGFRKHREHTEQQMEEVQQLQSELEELAGTGIFGDEEIGVQANRLLRMEHALQEMKEKVLQQIQKLESSGVEEMEGILDMLDQFPNQTPEDQNQTLKQFIRRIDYKRRLPEEIKALSANNRERLKSPFSYTIEYW